MPVHCKACAYRTRQDSQQSRSGELLHGAKLGCHIGGTGFINLRATVDNVRVFDNPQREAIRNVKPLLANTRFPIAIFLVVLSSAVYCAEVSGTLRLESKIPLGAVRGRIDHLSLDLDRQRLYVAELGNQSIGVVDLKTRTVIRTFIGFSEPQGLGYVKATDNLYVANAGDGTVRILDAADGSELGHIAWGSDADNVRVDDISGRVYVGYGSGHLAVINAADRSKTADVPLKAHPEGFQLESGGQRIFVNVPDAHEIAILDRATNKQVASWATGHLQANFPLTIDSTHHRALAVFRSPATLGEFNSQTGMLVGESRTCGDADDLFVDVKRERLYVICGEGYIAVWLWQSGGYKTLEQIPTPAGARTALYVPELDRLFLAVRATSNTPAAIWVYSPTP